MNAAALSSGFLRLASISPAALVLGSTPPSLVIETAEGQVDEESRPGSVARRLILLRHAKSSWANPSLRDHDRPLSQADAISISHKLQQLGWIPELILSMQCELGRLLKSCSSK